ncbi:major facilitator superfamily transporter [Tritrichomonas foetus]|uniref:Major facilitator superfamily transporter n=1 Tax=Tritrichomonas foetus TaxID=1144522 RepID=A0A1J4L5R6_9EUKA|nr:major facilitator superfamily transporter [Tritrichomonas foetus]|eukprot:OHT17294.1 major facilitator superfamily transporter [Tritrichomonas foetus]
MVNLIYVLCNRSFGQICVLLLASLSLGVAITFPSPTLTDIASDFQMSDAQSSLFNAITSLTAVVGPFITSVTVNKQGRRPTLFIFAFLCAISWVLLLTISYQNRNLAILHRAILGISIGGFSAVNPMYIMELSPFELRSIYGTMNQFGITLGIMITNFLGMYLNWRRLATCALLLPLLLMALLYIVVPESQAFLKSKNSKISSTFSNDNLASAAGQASHKPSLCGRRYLGSIIMGIMMMFFQQFSGINAVLSNLGTLIASRTGPTFAASAQCISCLLCITVIEIIGRKATWMISLFGSSLSMFVLAFNYSIVIAEGPKVSAICAFAYLFFFCFGLGPIPWFVTPEMFPDNLRGAASSLFSALNWIFSFIVVLIYPWLVDSIGPSTTLCLFSGVLAFGGFYGMTRINDHPKPVQQIGDETPSFADVMVDVSNEM